MKKQIGQTCFLPLEVTNLKINHYTQALKNVAKSGFEEKLWEVVVGFIGAVLSYKGFQINVAIIAFPMAAVCFICLTSIFISIYYAIKEEFFEN